MSLSSGPRTSKGLRKACPRTSKGLRKACPRTSKGLRKACPSLRASERHVEHASSGGSKLEWPIQDGHPGAMVASDPDWTSKGLRKACPR